MARTGSNEVRENKFQVWDEAATSPECPPRPVLHPQPQVSVRMSRRVSLENVNGALQFISPNSLKRSSEGNALNIGSTAW